MVRRRTTEYLLQLPGSPRRDSAQKQGGDSVGRRTRRLAHADLPAVTARGFPMRECAEVAGREERRSRRDLYGHGARVTDRVAGLRAHRRSPYGHLRRLFFAGADRSHQRLRSVGGDHAGCQLPSRRGSEIKGCGGSGFAALRDRQECAGLQAHRLRGQDGGRAAIIGGTS